MVKTFYYFGVQSALTPLVTFGKQVFIKRVGIQHQIGADISLIPAGVQVSGTFQTSLRFISQDYQMVTGSGILFENVEVSRNDQVIFSNSGGGDSVTSAGFRPDIDWFDVGVVCQRVEYSYNFNASDPAFQPLCWVNIVYDEYPKTGHW